LKEEKIMKVIAELPDYAYLTKMKTIGLSLSKVKASLKNFS
jgi:hypothetical protein